MTSRIAAKNLMMQLVSFQARLLRFNSKYFICPWRRSSRQSLPAKQASKSYTVQNCNDTTDMKKKYPSYHLERFERWDSSEYCICWFIIIILFIWQYYMTKDLCLNDNSLVILYPRRAQGLKVKWKPISFGGF